VHFSVGNRSNVFH